MADPLSNFDFLKTHSPQLTNLGVLAEKYFSNDPTGALTKLRQFAEFIAKDVAAQHGLLPAGTPNFDDALRALKTRNAIPREVADYFYHLKRVGNAAVHEDLGSSAEPLDPWHSTKPFRDKAAVSSKSPVKTFSPREIAAVDMANGILSTVSQANGQMAERRVKEKNTDLSRADLEALLLRLMGEQEDRCALTGLPLGYAGDCDDPQMRASPDRIDSKGHYTADNIQLVCWFINRWKGADDNQLALRLIAALRQP